MATRYTAGVADGSVTDFAVFAMDCARAFGACITLRDDMTSPIPDEFKPSSYRAEALAVAEAELASLIGMDDATKEAGFTTEFNRVLLENKEERNRNRIERKRYDDMLRVAQAWQPPTPDHKGLAEFMVKQLVESKEHDTGGSVYQQKFPASIEAWHGAKLENAAHNVEYHKTEHAKDVERAADRTRWVQQLRESLVAAMKGDRHA